MSQNLTSHAEAAGGRIPRAGFLGPEGTFTHMALQAWRDAPPEFEAVPFGSVDAALRALREGDLDGAMVPIENSVEGGVSATLDALSNGDPLEIIGEVLVPVTFVIAVRPGVALADVTRIGTHSHAWAQVRRWVGEHLPNAAYVPTLSTAAAAADLAADLDEDAGYDAAICARGAAEVHGLDILAEDIGDNSAAVTRFVAVTTPGRVPPPTGSDKTTFVLFQHLDKPGGLMGLLEQIAVRGINMTRLESRPTKESMGSYCFSIDVEGHISDARIGEALMGLQRVCSEVRFLGSYPRADGGAAQVPPFASDQAHREAQAWLA
uniref:prephenate dehydratase n=1 Tax=Kribbia dieselivorans TaxID=331526 RepID=UPI0008386DE4